MKSTPFGNIFKIDDFKLLVAAVSQAKRANDQQTVYILVYGYRATNFTTANTAQPCFSVCLVMLIFCMQDAVLKKALNSPPPPTQRLNHVA